MPRQSSFWVVLTVIAAILLLLSAGPMWYYRHLAEQRRIRVWIETMHGQADDKQIGSKWLNKKLESFGFEPIQDFYSMSLNQRPVTDADLTRLDGLCHLKTLDLSETQITDGGLAQLAKLTGLEDLELYGIQMTDNGLKYLKPLRHLKRLHLGNTLITDAGLTRISHC